MPFRDDVVVCDVFQRESGGNEVRSLWISLRVLRMYSVKKTISRELWMKNEADESALEAVVHGFRKHTERVVPYNNPLRFVGAAISEQSVELYG